MEPHRENQQSFYFEFVLTPMTTVGHKFISFFVTVTCFRDGPLEELWGGGGREIFEPQGFFPLSNSLYEFLLGHSMNIFLGLIGVHEFFFI